MKIILEYILFELKRFFKNIKLVLIFFISPLLATAVFALFAYQSPKDIHIALVNVTSNELSDKITTKIKENTLFKVKEAGNIEEGKRVLKSGEAKSVVEIDIADEKGEIKIIEDPRYPEIQGKVKEEIANSTKEIIKETTALLAESTAKDKYQKSIDQKFTEFTDEILGQNSNTPLSKTITNELDKIKQETVSQINSQVDAQISENLATSKTKLSAKLNEEVTSKFDAFTAQIAGMLPPGEVANTITAQLTNYRQELTASIESTINAEISEQMSEFQSKIKQQLVATVDQKFDTYKKRLMPSNPESPIYKAIKQQVDQFKTDLEQQDVDIAINTEPIKLESKEYLSKDIKYFDRYSSGAIPLVIVLIFLLKSATSMSQDRESGVLERLFSTPASRFKVMIAKIISNVLIGIVSLFAIILMLKFIFGAALGSWWLVLLISFIMAIVSVSMGMLISVITRDLASSIQFAFYTFFMIVLTSEFFFASENIHPYFRYFSKINPLTYAVSALRKVNLFNWGFGDIWQELTIMVSFAVIYAAIAIWLVSREHR